LYSKSINNSYREEQNKIMARQDEELDRLAESVQRLKSMGSAIGDEVNEQNAIANGEKNDKDAKTNSQSKTSFSISNLFPDKNKTFKPQKSWDSASNSDAGREINPNQRPIDKFTELQKVSGFWELDEEFASCVKISLSDLTTKIPEGLSINAWATAIAIVYLEKEFAMHRDEWFMLCEKARKWLRKELHKYALEFILAEASRLFK